jgi:hypothetical protein
MVAQPRGELFLLANRAADHLNRKRPPLRPSDSRATQNPHRVAQNGAIRPPRQVRNLLLNLQFAGILMHLLLPSQSSMLPSGKPGVHELALA